MLVIEEIIDRVGRKLGPCGRKMCVSGICIAGKGETNTTHYGQEMRTTAFRLIWGELRNKSSELLKRRR